MQENPDKRHIVDILFVLALFGVFTLSALVLVILGANIYRQTVSYMSANYESRTACSYLAEKVRQNDMYDSVTLESFEGTDALALSRTSLDMVTYIYFYDGSLREQTMRRGANIGSDPLGSGTAIMALEDFQFQRVNDRLVSLQLTTASGEEKTLFISTHCQ